MTAALVSSESQVGYPAAVAACVAAQEGVWGQDPCASSYYGAQNDYTRVFIVWEIISNLHRTSVTQKVSGGNAFV